MFGLLLSGWACSSYVRLEEFRKQLVGKQSAQVLLVRTAFPLVSFFELRGLSGRHIVVVFVGSMRKTGRRSFRFQPLLHFPLLNVLCSFCNLAQTDSRIAEKLTTHSGENPSAESDPPR